MGWMVEIFHCLRFYNWEGCQFVSGSIYLFKAHSNCTICKCNLLNEMFPNLLKCILVLASNSV